MSGKVIPFREKTGKLNFHMNPDGTAKYCMMQVPDDRWAPEIPRGSWIRIEGAHYDDIREGEPHLIIMDRADFIKRIYYLDHETLQLTPWRSEDHAWVDIEIQELEGGNVHLFRITSIQQKYDDHVPDKGLEHLRYIGLTCSRPRPGVAIWTEKAISPLPWPWFHWETVGERDGSFRRSKDQSSS